MLIQRMQKTQVLSRVAAMNTGKGHLQAIPLYATQFLSS